MNLAGPLIIKWRRCESCRGLSDSKMEEVANLTEAADRKTEVPY